jgi:flavin reductase (DIM6/NTAB) family NADH-FMN oxidoreductase RutF
VFAVNVLAHDQQNVSNQFAKSGTDKWAGIEWSRTGAGTPVLDNSLMWLVCEIWAEHDAGDHLIVLGRVNEMSPVDQRSKDPLLYYKGQYRHLNPDRVA